MKVPTKYGQMYVYEEDDYVSKSLRLLGEYAEYELEIMRKFWGPDKVVVDIGANIGAFTVPMAQENKEVIAFEPQRLMFQNLNANLVENSITNGITHQVAIGRERKIVRVPDRIGSNPGSHFVTNLNNRKHPFRGTMIYREDIPMSEVQMMPFTDKINISKKVDFIKIDVEGFELEILRGMKKYIDKFHPIMFIETDVEELKVPVQEFVYNRGYKYLERWYPLYRNNNFNSYTKRNPFLGKNGVPEGCTNTIAVPRDMDITLDDLQ